MIIDIAIILFVFIFAIIGIKRGFIKEIISLVGVVIAIVLSFWLAEISSEFIYDRFIKESVGAKITETICETADNSLASVAENIPESLQSAAKLLKIDLTTLLGSSVSDNIESTAATVSNNLMIRVVEPLCIKIILVISFIILFIILTFLINLTAKALNIVAKLPILKSFNRFLGCVVGALRGAVIIISLCYILYLLASVFDNGIIGLKPQYFNDSEIMKLIIK